MRILYVSHTHPPAGAIMDNVGGMQRVSRQLIDELKTCDDVTVQTKAVNVSGKGVGLKTTGFLLNLLATLPKAARKFEADIILFSSMVTASLAWLLRDRIDIPMVTINHGRDVTLQNSLYQRLVPRIFKALDGVISVSGATRKECIKRGMKPSKGVALSNGFNLETMQQLPEKGHTRSVLQTKFGIPLDEKLMLLTVGRKVRRKGHEWFIREVLPKVEHPVVYVTVGDGPEFEAIETSVSETNQAQDVFLLGRQPDEILQQAYAAADLFIMPNIPVEGDMEGFGIVLLEANMARTPAVASDLEGIKDVIANGENGYKVPVYEAETFARKINAVINENLDQLSQDARRYVQNHFTWQQVARQYVAYLKEIAQSYQADKSKK